MLVRSSNNIYKKLKQSLGMMPDFIIIGAQKAGTSSLYAYLTKHPLIQAASTKEIHFFDTGFSKGKSWYRKHFPSIIDKLKAKLKGKSMITGEASPYYLFHPLAPTRIFKTLPKVKLIVILRNPVDRAYSHYQHEVKLSFETSETFEEAISQEEKRLNGEVERIIKNHNYNSFNHQHHSYLSRGIYVDQLKVWFNLFGKSKVLVICSDFFYQNPSQVLKQVSDFLNLPYVEIDCYQKYNASSYSALKPDTRQSLINFFKPHNQRLYEYLGEKFDWDK